MKPCLARGGLAVLIAGSAITIPLADVGGITVTGDRLLGIAAVAAASLLAISGRFRWTPIHAGLALFTAVQIACSLLSAAAWPRGLQMVPIYVLGFACFALAAAWATPLTAQRWAARVWIAVGVSLSLLAAAAAAAANITQGRVWGAGIAQRTHTFSGDLLLFAGRATFIEWNLLCSFLLVPFSLALWGWADRGPWDRRSWIGIGLLGGMILGIVFGVTRAAWLGMIGVVAIWWWVRRPRPDRLVALAAIAALVFVAQTSVVSLAKRPGGHLATPGLAGLAPGPALRPSVKPDRVAWPGWWGSSPLVSRIVMPVVRGYDWNMAGRASISRATLESWRERPLAGHGAGSTNRLSVVLDSGERIRNLWNGNALLFVLHDSGIVGLAAFLGVLAVVAREGWRWARSRPDRASASVAAPLLAAGLALLFCYQFTHALWIMYPYVYLGLLTATLAPPAHPPAPGGEPPWPHG